MRFNPIMIRYCIITCISIAILPGCKKLVTVDPPVDALISTTVFGDDADASAALNGIYIRMTSNIGNGTLSGGPKSIGVLTGLSADELSLYPNADPALAQVWADAQNNQTNLSIWDDLYSYIYYCNAAIAGLSGSSGVSATLGRQLMGEAKFLRAFCFFNLIQLYGNVPMPLVPDYRTNASLPRIADTVVYHQVVLDLQSADSLLPATYSDGKGAPSTERTRPDKFTAIALLARVYLYRQDWQDAATQSSLLIADKTDYDTVSLNSVFLKNSMEAIWQLQPVLPNYNTYDADLFILSPGRPNTYYNSLYLSDRLISAFDPGDQREADWVGVFMTTDVPALTYYYPYKYKIPYGNTMVSEYVMVLRLGEQYLIRAEARAQQGDLAGAAADLNVIRTRAGLPNAAAGSQSQLLSDILHERQVELFTEGGHRWFDLIRTGKVDSLMNIVTPEKSGLPWVPARKLFPLQQTELAADPNLVQNPGY